MIPLPFDNDLLTFVLATVGTLLRAPRRLQQREPVPAEYEPEEVPAEKLTEKQKRFFEPYDQKLAAMHYFPVCTYRIANHQRTLLRRYACPVDPAYCTVIAAEVKYHYKGREQWAPTSLVTFRTQFTDGSALTTRNMKVKTLFNTLPGRVVQECPNTDEPQALKRKHDAKVGSMGCPQPFPSDVSRILDAVRTEHREFAEYQVKQGLYRRDPGGYALTSRAIWRGIRNHYNPFAQRVSPIRLALSALLATGIPAAAFWKVEGSFREAAGTGLGIGLESRAILLASYVLAGVAIGFLIERSPFLWGFLLTYVGVHVCTGWWISTIPFSMIAALTAFQVKRLRHRQRLMLQPRTASE